MGLVSNIFGSAADIARINGIGQWLNESYVVRLYALLNSRKIVSDRVSIDFDLPGSTEIDLLRRLRRVVAHTSGRYNADDPDEQKLCARLREHFGLANGNPGAENHYPLPIDEVLAPLTEACKEYVGAIATQEGC